VERCRALRIFDVVLVNRILCRSITFEVHQDSDDFRVRDEIIRGPSSLITDLKRATWRS
jgi:hypothetical protein